MSEINENLKPTGAILDPPDARDILVASLLPPGVSIPLPRKFSRRGQQSEVFLQKYGSCVGGAARSTVEYWIWKLTGLRVKVSDRFLYALAKELDGQPFQEGTWPRIMLKVMFGIGTPTLERWPIEPSPTHADFIQSPPQNIREEAIEHVLTGGFARALTYEELKRAIYVFGPVLVTVNVYDTYDGIEPSGKIKPSTGAGYRGPHENVAVGWDDDANNGKGEVELKNQWDKTWGDGGYGFLPLDYEPSHTFPLADMWSINDMVDATVTKGAPVALGYPVETATPFVTQQFGERPEFYGQFGLKGHNGLDFRTRDLKNRYIIAADDGEVILSQNDGGYGLCIRIRHTWGMSLYGHNSQLLVSDTGGPGGMPQYVRKGQRIAIPGNTGNTGNPPAEHLHFGIRINGVKNPGFLDWIDPTPYFRKTMSNSFFIQQGGTFGIGHPATHPEAIISDAMNAGLEVPLKPGVPDTEPADKRIDWNALSKKAYQITVPAGMDELPNTVEPSEVGLDV